MFSFEEEDDLFYNLAILLFRYLTAASPDTAADRIIKAGAWLPACDNPSGRAIAKQLLQQVKGPAHRASAGVGPEVAPTVILKTPSQKHAGPLFIKRNFDIWIAFIIS
jgi:hypothetical protein